MALAILLVALIALLVKDRQFWFGAEQANIESDMPEATVTSETTGRTPVRTARGTSATQPRRATVSKISADSSTNPAIVTTTRSTLRPLGGGAAPASTLAAFQQRFPVTPDLQVADRRQQVQLLDVMRDSRANGPARA